MSDGSSAGVDHAMFWRYKMLERLGSVTEAVRDASLAVELTGGTDAALLCARGVMLKV